jgi:hypothetical protein
MLDGQGMAWILTEPKGVPLAANPVLVDRAQ